MNAPHRDLFRPFDLDGARLWFHPTSGIHVRVDDPTTVGLRQRAPRVVMFGASNACNLSCTFCSRDAGARSVWTLENAAALLEGLAAAGTLEVAFGGGEPLLWPAFDALVERLHATTALALHITTNGTRLDDARLARLAGRLGQVRLSIYEVDWRPAAAALDRAGQRWGANVLVDEVTLDGLGALLDTLALAGAADVSLLSHVGGDPARQLSAAGRARLADLVAASPVPVRLSVCLGDALGVPRLLAGDCGAGDDFVTLTADGFVSPCSFHADRVAVRTAAEVLDVWRARREPRLPSDRIGCARRTPAPPSTVLSPGVRVWQAFSGNNSGECVLVATFEHIEDAQALLADLCPFEPDQPYPEAWKAHFAARRIPTRLEERTPEVLGVVGHQLLAHTSSTLSDDFPSLRALVWARGGFARSPGIHQHELGHLVWVLACPDGTRAQAGPWPNAVTIAHGALQIGAAPMLWGDAQQDAIPELLAWAGGRPIEATIVSAEIDAPRLRDVVCRLGQRTPRRARLALVSQGPFPHASWAAERGAFVLDDIALFDPAPRPGPLARAAHAKGLMVVPLQGDEVQLQALVQTAPQRARSERPDPTPLVTAATAALRRAGLRERVEAPEPPWGAGARLTVRTAQPRAVMTALHTVTGTARWWAQEVDVLTLAVEDLVDRVRRRG